jgi:hypothetical protein
MRVVTATYQDAKNLYWIQHLQRKGVPYTIYKKNDSFAIGQETPSVVTIPLMRPIKLSVKQKITSLTIPSVDIPNIGRCDYAFLYHIIQNYENLDDVTIFVKCNWFHHGLDFYGLVDQCQKYDYMVKGTHPETEDWTEKQKNHVPRDIVDRLSENNMDWYNVVFPDPTPPPGTKKGWGHGPCFSVSKRLILRHPKSIYEYLLGRFYLESGSFSLDVEKYHFPTYADLIKDVGINYHNELGRFYTLLFTHNLDSSGNYAIDEPDNVTQVKEKPLNIHFGMQLSNKRMSMVF